MAYHYRESGLDNIYLENRCSCRDRPQPLFASCVICITYDREFQAHALPSPGENDDELPLYQGPAGANSAGQGRRRGEAFQWGGART
jgi:hypothetical protein